jgi:hypothetical protein
MLTAVLLSEGCGVRGACLGTRCQHYYHKACDVVWSAQLVRTGDRFSPQLRNHGHVTILHNLSPGPAMGHQYLLKGKPECNMGITVFRQLA